MRSMARICPWDEVMDEIVADSTGDFLNDAEFAEKVIRNDRSMGQKILDWITSVRDALKELISRRGLRQANEALREDLSRYESARETWLSVLDMTSDLMKRSERTYENEQGNVNEDFVKFQRIIEDQKRKSIEERIDEALTGGGVGAHVYLGETPKFLIDEFNLQALPMMITNKHVKTTILNGKDTKHDHYHDLGKQKFIEAIQSIDAPVMVIKAENTLDLLIVTDKKDQKGNLIFAVIHPNGKGMINGVEIRSNITKSLYAKKTTNYIQKAVNDGRVLYINKKSQKTNLPRIQFPSDFESTSVKKSIAQYVRDVNMGNQGNQTQNNNSSDKNQFDIPEVKNKLDVSTAVEESKRFIAVHNLSERNLLRTLKLEGIPMPSIAVTNPKLGWNKFGEISLLFRRDAVDPESSEKNKIYGADAWTPTFPLIEYEADADRSYSVYNIFREIQAMPVEMFEAKPQRVVGFDEIASAIIPNNSSSELKQALEERGIDYREYDPEITDDRKRAVQSVDDILFQLDIPESASVKDLAKENEELRKANNYLQDALNVYRGNVPSDKSVRKIAKEMIDMVGSNVEVRDVQEQIKNLYTYIASESATDSDRMGTEVSRAFQFMPLCEGQRMIRLWQGLTADFNSCPSARGNHFPSTPSH